ncbi:hypothetical protein [uncultured Sphingomonas sp.]|uniref:hypothetical protein n=1 Tax=uncultured Sphingomonas sp. TaxID=158754 RepID=UPI0025D8D850|nr:hypothetical protein [uncultured Sphingomonas sp.]
MRIGIGLGVTSPSALRRLVPPVVVPGDVFVALANTSPADDITPTIAATISGAWQTGDVLEWQIDTNPSFTSTAVQNAGAVIGGPSFTDQTEPLYPGTYYLRARVVRGTTTFAWSPTITITIAASNDRIDSSTLRIDTPLVRIG